MTTRNTGWSSRGWYQIRAGRYVKRLASGQEVAVQILTNKPSCRTWLDCYGVKHPTMRAAMDACEENQ